MMTSSGEEALDIKTVYQCNRCLGCKTPYPQVSIIRLDHTNMKRHSIKSDFYTILSMRNSIEDCCCCERKAYSYSNAAMVLLPPEQIFDIHRNRVLSQQGWLLAFHPDLLYGTILEKNVQKYTFSSYRKEEVLHLSQCEGDKIMGCLRKMDEELHHPIDHRSQTLISRYIGLLLDYCARFYERQLTTRENRSKALLDKTDRLSDDHIYFDKLKWEDSPISAYRAGNLKLSVIYFEDLLTFKTSKALLGFFQLRRMETVKKMLLDKENIIKTVAG